MSIILKKRKATKVLEGGRVVWICLTLPRTDAKLIFVIVVVVVVFLDGEMKKEEEFLWLCDGLETRGVILTLFDFYLFRRQILAN